MLALPARPAEGTSYLQMNQNESYFPILARAQPYRESLSDGANLFIVNYFHDRPQGGCSGALITCSPPDNATTPPLKKVELAVIMSLQYKVL